MIRFIGRSSSPNGLFFTYSTFKEFEEWIVKLPIYQLDTETNVVDSIVDRKLKLIQFGDVYGKDQWVIDPRCLTKDEAKRLVEILSNPNPIKIAHNASFEYQILKKYGISLSNVWDTMLVEKVIWCGYKTMLGFYSLAGLSKRYLFIDLDKTLQTSFDMEVYSAEQVFYAAKDVQNLGFIMRLQKDELKLANLEYVAALENEAVLGFSEIEYTGMKLDLDAWRANIDLAEPLIIEAKEKLDTFVRSEEFKDKCIELKYLTDKDELQINWNSPLTKKLVFGLLFPELSGATQAIIKKYIKNFYKQDKLDRDSGHLFSEEYSLNKIKERLNVWELESYLEGDNSFLEERLLDNHKQFLIDNELLVPNNTVSINWQSSKQRLEVFKIVEPHLKGTDKEQLADCDHPIIEAYHEYINNMKLKGSFGEKFIEKFVDSDGKVRTNFNQILNTGRVSSSKPNIQQIPAKESVGNRYRNAFIADEGWLFVDSDYKSQELVILAHFSKDPVWAEALRLDQDLHSVCAEQVFGDEWVNGASDKCEFYYPWIDKYGKQYPALSKQKCSCKRHKTLRTLVKTINFGLAFGMTKFKLSALAKNNKIDLSLDEAQQTIDDYFSAFPGIKGILNAFGKYGVDHGYIMTSKPFLRRRYYDYWERKRDSDYWMSKVERASKNVPIQGTAADITKIALCLIKWYIEDNKLENKVKLVAQVHDQITTNVIEEYAEEWKGILDKLMCEAAAFIIPSGLLGADTQITGKCWSK